MYEFKSRIRYSECGVDSRLSLEALLDYFQDSSIFDSEDIGLGVNVLQAKNRAWVLSSWQIIVERYPKLCEEVVIGTAPYDFKGFVGYRNFWMDTADGERLAYANSIWSFLDMEKMAPVRLPADIIEAYTLSEKLDMDYAPRRINVPEGGDIKEKLEVRPHNLDTNGHVNNGQYVRIAIDYIPEDFSIRQLRVEYKKQAVLNDIIVPVVAVTENGKVYTVSLNTQDGAPYSIIELK